MTKIPRRSLLTAGVSIVLSTAHSRVLGANDRINIAVIGLGGRGRDHMNEYASHPALCRVAALCDVNQAALERGSALIRSATKEKPKEYTDMRQVFDDKELDAVSMPLPNHWHALATIWACQAGKDVYIEKPASHDIFEGLKMVEAARKYNRIVQVGSQSRSLPYKQKAVQLLHQGIIGKIYLAKGICFNRRISIGHTPETPVPAGIDWDRFLGPAPMRPYTENRYKYNWHWFWDTGNGDIGNQGIHEMDVARWALGKDVPNDAYSTGGKYAYHDDQETPNTQVAIYNYDDARLMFDVRGLLTGGEGGLTKRGPSTIGNLFYGTEGWMAMDWNGFQVYKGESSEKIMDERAPKGSDTALHVENFLKAVRTRNYKDLNADVEVGVRSVILVHMANISYRLGRKLTLDPRTMKFINDPEANGMLTRAYRKPYMVPDAV